MFSSSRLVTQTLSATRYAQKSHPLSACSADSVVLTSSMFQGPSMCNPTYRCVRLNPNKQHQVKILPMRWISDETGRSPHEISIFLCNFNGTAILIYPYLDQAWPTCTVDADLSSKGFFKLTSSNPRKKMRKWSGKVRGKIFKTQAGTLCKGASDAFGLGRPFLWGEGVPDGGCHFSRFSTLHLVQVPPLNSKRNTSKKLLN